MMQSDDPRSGWSSEVVGIPEKRIGSEGTLKIVSEAIEIRVGIGIAITSGELGDREGGGGPVGVRAAPCGDLSDGTGGLSVEGEVVSADVEWAGVELGKSVDRSTRACSDGEGWR